MYMHIFFSYNWLTLLYTENYYYIANQLNFNFKKYYVWMNLADVTIFLITSLFDQITWVFLEFNYAVNIQALKECTDKWVEKGRKSI